MAHDQQGSAMNCSYDEISIDEYAEKSYMDLKAGKFVARLGSDRFRCPFCPGKKKQDYCYNELLQHAGGVGASNHAAKVKAYHQALAKFLKEDHADAAATLPPWQTIALSNPPKPVQDQEVFVWPLMGILTNVPAEEIQGRGAILMEQLGDFKPVKVTAVYGDNGYTGHVIVLFTKDLIGFKNALAFDDYFKSQRLGKLEWEEKQQHVNYIFGWLAKEDDYESDHPVGSFLSANGDLKKLSKLEQQMPRKKHRLTFDLEESEGSELLPAKKKLKYATNMLDSEQGSQEATDVDVFSLLPNDLVWSFLSCYLSMYDAAKIATLSKDLLSAWRSYPQLSFTLGKNPSLHMLRAVGSVLEKHDEQSIKSCLLHGFFQNVSENLDNWLQILKSKSSKNFSLEIYSRSAVNLENSIFHMNNISELRLHRCVIGDLEKVTFPCLTKLSLKYCVFLGSSKNDLQQVISGCPNCIEMELVKIIVPQTLPYLRIDINQLLLKDLSLKLEESHTTWTVCSKHLSYAKIKVAFDLNSQLLEQVKHAEKLTLSAMEILDPITFEFDNLVGLTLDLFMDQNSMAAVFNLLHHAPYLKYFEIEFNDMGLWNEPEVFWEQQQSGCFPVGLEVVHVKGFTGTDLSAGFLKFVASRPSVQKIMVTLDQNIHVTGYENAIRVLDMLRKEYPSVHLTVSGQDEKEQ